MFSHAMANCLETSCKINNRCMSMIFRKTVRSVSFEKLEVAVVVVAGRAGALTDEAAGGRRRASVCSLGLAKSS